MIHIETVKITLPLKKRFAVAHGATEAKVNLLTIMNNRYNGEASGSVHYGPEIEELTKDVDRAIKMLKSEKEITKETLDLIAGYDISSTARSALSAMVLNYLSGELKRYPWEIVSLGAPIGVKSSITVGIDDPARMIDEIQNSPYPIIKVKMGNEEDVLLLDGLEHIVGKEIRVDANGAWTCAKAEEMIHSLAKRGVTIIEQPTDAAYVEEWPHLKGKNDQVQLFMDEGLNSLIDYKKYEPFIDGVNIKMEKCGGIVEGVKIARVAKEANKKVMLGCMVESSVGIAQSVYMSSLADYFDLDAPLLLKDDIADGIRYDLECIEVDREIIGGPKLKRDVVEKYITD